MPAWNKSLVTCGATTATSLSVATTAFEPKCMYDSGSTAANTEPTSRMTMSSGLPCGSMTLNPITTSATGQANPRTTPHPRLNDAVAAVSMAYHASGATTQAANSPAVRASNAIFGTSNIA